MSTRHAAVAVSIVLAAILNASALGMAGRWASVATPVGAAPHETPAHASVILLSALPRPVAMPAPMAALASTPSRAAPVRPAARPAAAVARAPAHSVVAPEPTDGAPQSLRLYTFHEVDRAAEPETDWPLDVDTLEAIGIQRLVFELMVSERGEVIACSVLDPLGLDDAVRSDLEQRLAQTSLRPALRGGRFVASLRRIELLVEAEH